MAGEKKVAYILYNIQQCIPLGFGKGLSLRFFRKGETLSKSYIVEKMMEDLTYGDYVPNNIKPFDLRRKFLITVRIGYIY